MIVRLLLNPQLKYRPQASIAVCSRVEPGNKFHFVFILRSVAVLGLLGGVGSEFTH